MGLPKGRTNNPQGKPKGATNKTTTEIREIIADFVSTNIVNLQAKYDQLDAKEQLKFIEKLLQYTVPRLNSQHLEILEQSNNTISPEEFWKRVAGD